MAIHSHTHNDFVFYIDFAKHFKYFTSHILIEYETEIIKCHNNNQSPVDMARHSR